VSRFFSGGVGRDSVLVPPTTNAYAQRAASIKEATSQLTEWKLFLAVPILRVKMA